MSRSRKKPIVKGNGYMKSLYHKIIRRISKQALKQGREIPDPKTIIDDYDYIEYKLNYDYNFNSVTERNKFALKASKK